MRLIIRSIIFIFVIQIASISFVLLSSPYFSRGVIACTLSNARQNSTVMLIDTGTGQRINLLQGISVDNDITGRTPVWSPDGQYLAFWTFHNRQDTFVYELELNRVRFQNLTTAYDYFSLPVYGANNQRLFASFPIFDEVPLFLVNEQYPGGRQIINMTVSMPSWSPDGSRIAFASPQEAIEANGEELVAAGDIEKINIYVSSISDGTITNYTENLSVTGVPIWSPDGRRIVIVGNEASRGKLFQIDLETEIVDELPVDSFVSDIPVWSPDGQYLAFTSNSPGSNNPEIIILNMNSFETRNISNSPVYDIQPTWSPDGRFVAFVSQRGGNQDEIFIANIETGHIRRLTYTELDESDISWQPR